MFQKFKNSYFNRIVLKTAFREYLKENIKTSFCKTQGTEGMGSTKLVLIL